MDSKPTDPHSLREHLKDEMLDAVDEELELELDDPRLADVLGSRRPARGRPTKRSTATCISGSCCGCSASW